MAKKKKKDKEDEISLEDLGIKKSDSAPKTTKASSKKTTKKKTTSSKKKTKSTSSSKKTSAKKSSKKSTKKTTKKAVKKTTKKKTKKKKDDFIQSDTNVGLVGHVDHGKTTLVKALSGVWTERYADEVNRGITIKLGYAEAAVMECPECGRIMSLELANSLRKSKKDPKGRCPDCQKPLKFRRRISFVDAPGHEILMATMLSGASLMDGAVLLVAANEPVGMPQTKEHLAALSIAKIENIIIVQNKIDSITKERAFEHFKELKQFLKQYPIAKNAPIIPASAVFGANVDVISQKIEEYIPSPDLDDESDFLFNVARSFDVNKPGTEIAGLTGGVLGGSIVSGSVSVGDDIEIRPGFKSDSGKYKAVVTKVTSIFEGSHPLETAGPGGLIALGTQLDPSNTRTDQLIGNVAGTVDTLPDTKYSVKIEAHLLDKVLGAEEEIEVQPIKKNELLMVVVGTMTTAGVVKSIGKHNTVELSLKRPICALEGSIVAISRRINNRFRLIGYGYLL